MEASLKRRFISSYLRYSKDFKVCCTTTLHNHQAHNSAGKCFLNGRFGCLYETDNEIKTGVSKKVWKMSPCPQYIEQKVSVKLSYISLVSAAA